MSPPCWVLRVSDIIQNWTMGMRVSQTDVSQSQTKGWSKGFVKASDWSVATNTVLRLVGSKNFASLLCPTPGSH